MDGPIEVAFDTEASGAYFTSCRYELYALSKTFSKL